jgi:hypothetical protein
MDVDKCIRCGGRARPVRGAYDEPGKPSCQRCYSDFCTTSGPEFQSFPSWAIAFPIEPAAPPAIEAKCKACGDERGNPACATCGEPPRAILKVDDGEVSPYEKLKARVAELETQLATAIQAKTNFGDICGERDQLRRKVAELESTVFKLRGDLVRAQGQKRRPW